MLPGKQYKPEDFLQAAWSRKWLIVLPALLATAGTAFWSMQLPNQYRSSTTILVVPQQVPENVVRPTVTASLSERLRTIHTEILSRTRLERIIEEFNLYREERQTMIMEDIVDRMRTRDIRIQIMRQRRGVDSGQFTVSYMSPQPRLAMQVADRLGNMFVQENLEVRAGLADSTSQFLQAQLEDARRRLVEHEAKLQGFRQRNMGRLPSQSQSNMQMMQVTQSQIQSNNAAAARERDRLMTIESAIADAVTVSEQRPPTTGPEGEKGTAAQQLEAARAALRNMERRFTPTHPDIAQAKRVIAQLEVRAAEEAANRPSGAVPGSKSTGVALPPGVASKVTSLQLEAEQLRKSLEKRKADDERLRQVFTSYTTRLEAAPQLESEMTELMRDYGTIEDQYQTLLRRSEESKIALNLERRAIGEQFKVMDGARLPERPVSPNRTRYNLTGLIAGLCFGLALVALLEYRDTTLKTDSDVVASLALPVLAVIPLMSTEADRRRFHRRRVLLAISAAAVLSVGLGAVAAWRFDLLRGWLL